MNALNRSKSEEISLSYLNVLMHMSCFPSTAQQLCQNTDMFAQLPTVVNVFGCNMGSPLLPLLLDVLWNMLDSMPRPCVLPAKVLFRFLAVWTCFSCSIQAKLLNFTVQEIMASPDEARIEIQERLSNQNQGLDAAAQCVSKDMKPGDMCPCCPPGLAFPDSANDPAGKPPWTSLKD